MPNALETRDGFLADVAALRVADGFQELRTCLGRQRGRGQFRAPARDALFEPQGVDSLVAWGFFNSAFESKEYMEPYVEEQVAAEMLAHNPKVAADFKQRLATDPQFAADPDARLEYFYRLSPSWDERFDLYPVYRVDNPALK